MNAVRHWFKKVEHKELDIKDVTEERRIALTNRFSTTWVIVNPWSAEYQGQLKSNTFIVGSEVQDFFQTVYNCI